MLKDWFLHFNRSLCITWPNIQCNFSHSIIKHCVTPNQLQSMLDLQLSIIFQQHIVIYVLHDDWAFLKGNVIFRYRYLISVSYKIHISCYWVMMWLGTASVTVLLWTTEWTNEWIYCLSISSFMYPCLDQSISNLKHETCFAVEAITYLIYFTRHSRLNEPQQTDDWLCTSSYIKMVTTFVETFRTCSTEK